MEIRSVHTPFHHGHPGEEKHQMLNLNRRLETYLSRVKLLEEENALLAKEIQALRHSNQGATTRRRGLEEELRQARLEVDAAWMDRVHTELEVGKLTEELQALDLRRQKEAQAQVEANTKLKQSRKDLDEEHRAQIWLRQKVSQLEHEMRLLIQTHQDDVAHLETTITHCRATMPPTMAQRGNLTPNLLQLEQEYSQRANRAWQETAEAYQSQLAQLEESLNQTRSRLMQAGQEKSENQLRLQALEKEIASAQDVRLHLEKTVSQQRDKHSQELQQLQDHLEGLEVEKEKLGRQIDRVLLENRGLQQLKMSLGLEVSTYRALLDSESFKGDISLLNRPRNISITDAVFSPQRVKENYRTQLPVGHQTASFSSVCGITGRQKAIKATSVWSLKPATFTETPTISRKHGDDNSRKISTCATPYPKILQDGAVENFRPQEVHEKVTYAEPLSPPNEHEALNEEEEVDGNDVGVEPPEEKTIESVISCQVESGLSSKLHVNKEISLHQFTAPDLTSHSDRMTEEPSSLSDECDKDVLHKMSAEEQELQQPHAPINAWEEKERTGEEVEDVHKETSDSETEAVLEPTFESRTSSPLSEGSVCNQVTDLLKEDAVEIRQEISCSMVETHEMEVEDKLYPDGEEMDTWDSVIERKIDLKTDDGIKKDEAKQQHAEPEEDISVRESERNEKETKQDFEVQQDINTASFQVDDRQQAAVGKQHSPLSDQEKEEEENDEEEDSQNLSVSWRTEVESDSYALENTLADTRPLIRYKSDETDGNTQASHMDESESSEGEQEKKAGETGTGTWSEGKSKKFGTMEDLCEEAEGEAVDEEYDLVYTHIQDRDVSHGMTVSECATLVNDDENKEEMIKKVSEEHSDEETEELAKHAVPTYVDYELETDRLVEQELENLSTDIYSAHFAQQQDDESEVALPLQDMTEQEEAGETKTEDTSSFTVNHEPYENLCPSDLSVVAPQTDAQADQDVHDKDHDAIDAPEKREEEDEHNVSMVTHADVTEDQSLFSDFISRSDMEEINNPTSTLHLTADQENLQDAANVSQEHEVQDVEVPETAEWDVLENPSEDSDIRDQDEDDEKHDDMPESAESYLHNDGATDEGAMIHTEKALEISPDSLPDENDIFLVKDSTELLKTKGKDNGLHDFFSSGVNSDFWVSSLETGATFQPDDAWNEAAEQTNKNLGFGDSVVWGNSENSNVVNWSSRVDIDSSKAPEPKKEQEQMHLEVKQQVLCGNVEGELVHSEESEIEGESWSSGEE
ncbi:hypothetical protein PAMP_002581 [Pampus punctatissimus]